MSAEETERLIGQGIIHGGMLPKVRCALDAVKAGVRKAQIVDGRVERTLRLLPAVERGWLQEVVGPRDLTVRDESGARRLHLLPGAGVIINPSTTMGLHWILPFPPAR